MKAVILDPRNGDGVADLYVLNPVDRTIDVKRLGYVPELCFDPMANELLSVETDLESVTGKSTSYWLRMYDAESLSLIREIETPMRPMYAGFPNRSTRVRAASSGRYVYFQELFIDQQRDHVYRTGVGRFDRRAGNIQHSKFLIDSCTVDFGQIGTTDNELFFHLCCEEPSTVAFCNFGDENLQLIRMSKLGTRKYSSQETCGSWLDIANQSLYCTDHEGHIYCAKHPPYETKLFVKLPLHAPRSVPLQHIYGAANQIFVGVAKDDGERSLSLASEIWVVSIPEAAVLRVITLDAPVFNFVTTPDAGILIGVDPFVRLVQIIDLFTGKLVDKLSDFGITPGEVQLIGASPSS